MRVEERWRRDRVEEGESRRRRRRQTVGERKEGEEEEERREVDKRPLILIT